MKTFTAYRWVVNEVGRIHLSNVHFTAKNWNEAEVMCAELGWALDGELLGSMEIPTTSEMSAACDAHVKALDQEWLTTGRKRIVIA